MPTTNKEETMDFDPAALERHIEESADLHADAMTATRRGLAELPERPATTTPTARPAFSGLLGATTIAGAAVALSAAAASAGTSGDLAILQTAQSIENLAIATYTVALTLPFIGGASANGVVKAFVTQTRAQHRDHDAAFGAAITRLGGKVQNSPDPVLAAVVAKAKPGLTSAAKVVALALELEDGAAQTYVANTSAIKDSQSREVLASIMGVEAQHAAVLRAVGALLAGGDGALIALPPNPLTSLPAAAGAVGFPNAFYPTSAARPSTEGALSK
jgi:hypothetical protein